ncbi:MAG: carbohydrate binding family 9 domain-containing protein, partial [Cyclobacteriaceae bacterium]
MIQRVTILFGFILVVLRVNAQHLPETEFHIKKAISAIQLDGALNEVDWQTGSVATGFFMNNPVDSIAPQYQTEFRMTFDEDNLYIGLTAFDDDKTVLIQSLRRDFEFSKNDNMGIYVDTYNDKTNGFFFNVNPFGVQREGLMSSGGNEPADYSAFWDNKWYTAAAQYDDRWVVEIAIPFKSIRYNDDNWNFNVMRKDAKRNEWSSWIAAPLQYYPSSFVFSGKMIWDDAPPKPGMNISLIPYLTGSAVKDNEAGTSTEYDPG